MFDLREAAVDKFLFEYGKGILLGLDIDEPEIDVDISAKHEARAERTEQGIGYPSADPRHHHHDRPH